MFVWYALYFCLQSLDINIYLLFQQQILMLETGNFLWEMKSNTANFHFRKIQLLHVEKLKHHL